MKVETIHLFIGDELRLTCVGPTKVTVESEAAVHGTIGDAIEIRDAEIARLRAFVDGLRDEAEEGIRADADAIIDRLVERLRR